MSDTLFAIIVIGSIVTFCVASLWGANKKADRISRDYNTSRDGRIFETVEEAQRDLEECSDGS